MKADSESRSNGHLPIGTQRNSSCRSDPSSLPNTVPTATFWALFTDSRAFLSCTVPKIGVAIMLVHIFRPRIWFKNAILGSAIGLVMFCIVGFVICFVQCNPVAGPWDPYKYPDVKCWPRDVQIDYALVGSCKSIYTVICLTLLTECLIRSLFGLSRLCICRLSWRSHLGLADENMRENQYNGTHGPGLSVSSANSLARND